ncbi:hypothetical protein ACLB2K_017628 [Fragaria x ananassa]
MGVFNLNLLPYHLEGFQNSTTFHARVWFGSKTNEPTQTETVSGTHYTASPIDKASYLLPTIMLSSYS